MKKTKGFNNILDDCLERLLFKGETIEQCLQSYPEHAVELKPLLQTAMATKKALAIQPPPEFKAKARYQFYSALREVKPKRGLSLLSWQPRWVAVTSVVLGLLLAGGGTVTAASYSMPDSLLYPVKLATEQVQVTLTVSDTSKAKLYAKLADRRVAEIVYVVDKGRPKQIERTAQRLNNHLAMIAGLSLVEEREKKEMPAETLIAPSQAPAPVPQPQAEASASDIPAPASERGRLKILLKHNAANHPAVLRAVLKRAPESAKPALRRAIAASEASYKQALDDLD